MAKKMPAFRAAFPYTVPIFAGFAFLGMAYGVLMHSKGFSVWWTLLMSGAIFAGSMEFVAVNLLLSAFNPFYAFFLTLMVNARHLFYGISMLEKYKGLGWKKPYLIFGMCDETFSILCVTEPPAEVDRGWFMFFVTALNQFYWVFGAVMGNLLGAVVTFNSKGLEFVMTALFVVIFVEQWRSQKTHTAALVGLGASALCLLIFGAEGFILPAMGAILLTLTVLGKSQWMGGGNK